MAVEKVFASGDLITLDLPSDLQVKDWGKDGQFVEKGPLLYTYGMKGDRRIDETEERSSKDFPAYNIYPDKPFNYAILPEEGLSFEKAPVPTRPWSLEDAPLTVKVKARQVHSWRITRKKVIEPVYNLYTRPWVRERKEGNFTFTPRYPASKKALLSKGLGEKETITLVPYGAAKVRITVFPKLPKD